MQGGRFGKGGKNMEVTFVTALIGMGLFVISLVNLMIHLAEKIKKK